MKHEQYLGELSGMSFDKRAWLIAFFISLVINVGLTAALLIKKESRQTTFLPPTINQAFTLTNGSYSNAYVEQVATWFIAQTLNYTPASYEYQLSTFLKHVDPALFGQLRQKLTQEFDDIKQQRRSSMFFTQKVHIRGLAAIVEGTRQIKIGSTNAKLDKEFWYVKLAQRKDGLVTLTDFKQVAAVDVKTFLN